MDKKQLKKMLKPLIKQCVREALIEEGLLSSIVAEVVSGVKAGETLLESKKPEPKRTDNPQPRKRLNHARKKLMEAVGKNSYNDINLFEGTEPLRPTGPAGQGALSGIQPEDSGIDISAIPGSGNWAKLIN